MTQVTTPAQKGKPQSAFRKTKKIVGIGHAGIGIASAVSQEMLADATVIDSVAQATEPTVASGKKALTKTCIFTKLHIELASDSKEFRGEVKSRIDSALREADLGLVHKVEGNPLGKKGKPKLEVVAAVNTDRIVEVFDLLNPLLQDKFFGRTRTRVGDTTVQAANGKDYTFANIPMKHYVRSKPQSEI